MEVKIKRKPGPKPKLLTEAERKQHKKEQNRIYMRGRVILADQIFRWKEIKSLEGLKSDAQVAEFLMNRYQEALKAQRTSTPAFTFGKLSDGTQPVPSTSFGMAYRNLPPHVQSAKANWQSTWGVSAEGYACESTKSRLGARLRTAREESEDGSQRLQAFGNLKQAGQKISKKQLSDSSVEPLDLSVGISQAEDEKEKVDSDNEPSFDLTACKLKDVARRNIPATSTLPANNPTLVRQLNAGTRAGNGFGSGDDDTCTGSEGEVDMMGLSDTEMGPTIPEGRPIKVEKETSYECEYPLPTGSQSSGTSEQRDSLLNRAAEECPNSLSTSLHCTETAEQGTVDLDKNREPENFQMDCETVHEDNLHENTEVDTSEYVPITVGRRNNGPMSSNHVLSIHGLPVNQPFSLKYPSPITGNIVESKIYVIVEQQFVPHLKATPIKIDVKGHVRQLSVQPNNLGLVKNLGKEMGVVDTNNQTQSLDLFESHSDSTQGMPGISKELEGFENVTIKMELDDDEKYGIISDIIKDLIDKVVTEDNFGCSTSKRKRRHQTYSNITKKQRLLKYEDHANSELPHSARLRSRGYRINYADMDRVSDLSDISDLEDIFTDPDESDNEDSMMTDNVECEVRDNSMQKKAKSAKMNKEEDPDFDVESVFMTESNKKKLSMPQCEIQNSQTGTDSDTAHDLATDECSIEEKKIIEKEKMIAERLEKKLKEESKRIKVSLKDHPDKYHTEEQVSIERKFRGLKEAEKTFKLLVCSICNLFRTSNAVLLETHLEHHLNGDWTCKKCKFDGKTLQEYTKHVTENHSSRKKCPVCRKRCGCKKQLGEHLVTVHNMLPFICTRCSTKKSFVTFKDRREYYQHYLENHKDTMHHCVFCDSYFLNNAARRFHACSGKEGEKIACHICGKEMRPASLKLHLRRVHDNVRPFPCKQCNFAAKAAKELRLHTAAKHEGGHQFKCDYCDFTCVRKSQLDSHMRTHTGDKPYKCDLCPYSAAWKVQLKEHRQLHGNPIAQACEVCGIVMRKGASYNNHVKKHKKGTL